MSTDFHHVTVLLHETVDAIAVKPDGIYADLTTGGGGHSYEIAKQLGDGGRLLCFDRDAEALSAARIRLAPFLDKITFLHRNFESIGSALDELGITALDGAIADLGCSSHQFDTPERGFAYQYDAPLDMRMDTDSPLTAAEVVNTYSEAELFRIIHEYGEERFASRIASRIVSERKEKPIETTFALSDIIKGAIRIEVNRELDAITPAIQAITKALVPGGRISIISFHSLEDRIVKLAFAAASSGCTCPRDFPVCVCGKKPLLKILTKKPILPSPTELEDNPRARSAKLRVAEKI